MLQRFDESKRHYRWEEAFAALALEAAFPQWPVFEHPEGAVDLVPDVVAGPSPGHPRAVVCVTRGSAQNAVQVKAWRDAYELLLYRRTHPQAILIRVVFGERGSKAWAHAMERLFDVHAWIRDLPGGAETEAFLHGLTREGGAVPGRAILLERLPAGARVCLNALAGQMRQGHAADVSTGGHLAASADLCEPFAPTALRRAVILGALAGSLEEDGRKVARAAAEELRAWGVCDARGYLLESWARQVVFARAAVGGGCFSELVRQAAPLCRVSRQRLRAAGRMLDFFRDWFFRLSACGDPERRLGLQLRLDPHACAPFGGHPVLLAMRYLLKAHGKDAFGHSRLLAQLGQGRDTHDLLRAGRWFSGQEPIPEHLPWERVFPWVAQAADILKSMPDPARRIGDLIFYDEAMKNPHVEPLAWLLESLKTGDWVWEPRRATLLDPSGRVGTVRCLRYGNTVFHWKSAHEGHRDKTKELAAKGMAMRLLQPRARYVLLIDGDFTERDAGSLAEAGAWDAIVPISSWNTEGRVFVQDLLRGRQGISAHRPAKGCR